MTAQRVPQPSAPARWCVVLGLVPSLLPIRLPEERSFCSLSSPRMAVTVSQEAGGRLGLEAIVPLLPCPVPMGPGGSAAASCHGAAPGWMRQRLSLRSERRVGPLNSGQQRWDNGGRRGHERGPGSKGECLKRSRTPERHPGCPHADSSPHPRSGTGLRAAVARVRPQS